MKFMKHKYLSSTWMWLLFLILTPLPFFYLLFSFHTDWQNLNSLEERLVKTHKKSVLLKAKKDKENLFLSKIQNADHFYIDKQLENLVFLEPEIKRLQLTLDEDEKVKKRLSFLKEGSNRFLFVEDKIRSNESVQELEEKLQHPVEMNESDLKKVLTLVEGVRIGEFEPLEYQPQLIIKNFDLSKKVISADEDAYLIDMQLIKRERVTHAKE